MVGCCRQKDANDLNDSSRVFGGEKMANLRHILEVETKGRPYGLEAKVGREKNRGKFLGFGLE